MKTILSALCFLGLTLATKLGQEKAPHYPAVFWSQSATNVFKE